MAFGDQDMAIFFQDGSLATVGAVTAKVHLDYPEELSQFGGNSLPSVVMQKPRMTYATASFPGLKAEDTVTIGAETFKVRQARKLDDGLISTADLKKG